MTAHHNPKDKILLHQPDIAALHIQRAKAAKFNRATLALQKCARAAVTDHFARRTRHEQLCGSDKRDAVSIAIGFKDSSRAAH
jgi:hypothetical protein